MKWILAIIISFFMLPNTIIGQSFSKEEQKVIEGVESYWADFNSKDKKRWQNVFHDSYKGWSVENEYINTKKDNINGMTILGEKMNLFFGILHQSELYCMMILQLSITTTQP